MPCLVVFYWLTWLTADTCCYVHFVLCICLCLQMILESAGILVWWISYTQHSHGYKNMFNCFWTLFSIENKSHRNLLSIVRMIWNPRKIKIVFTYIVFRLCRCEQKDNDDWMHAKQSYAITFEYTSNNHCHVM